MITVTLWTAYYMLTVVRSVHMKLKMADSNKILVTEFALIVKYSIMKSVMGFQLKVTS